MYDKVIRPVQVRKDGTIVFEGKVYKPVKAEGEGKKGEK